MYDDYETTGDQLEAHWTAQLDADLEMAELTRAGNAMARARDAGRCTHDGVAGYHNPPLYPEQEGLKPGQMRCLEHTGGCNEVFNSHEDWFAAMNEAIGR